MAKSKSTEPTADATDQGESNVVVTSAKKLNPTDEVKSAVVAHASELGETQAEIVSIGAKEVVWEGKTVGVRKAIYK